GAAPGGGVSLLTRVGMQPHSRSLPRGTWMARNGILLILATALVAGGSGCGSMLGLLVCNSAATEAERMPPPYSGALLDLKALGMIPREVVVPDETHSLVERGTLLLGWGFFLVDLPLSAAADTVLLSLALSAQKERAAQ